MQRLVVISMVKSYDHCFGFSCNYQDGIEAISSFGMVGTLFVFAVVLKGIRFRIAQELPAATKVNLPSSDGVLRLAESPFLLFLGCKKHSCIAVELD